MFKKTVVFTLVLVWCGCASAQGKVVVVPLGDETGLAGGTCSEGQYMQGITSEGAPICASLNDYVNSNCSVYLGWRDDCDGCTLAPVKIGRANGVPDTGTSNCEVSGADSNCITATVFNESVQFAGINPDGSAVGDDKFYLGFKCIAAGSK